MMEAEKCNTTHHNTKSGLGSFHGSSYPEFCHQHQLCYHHQYNESKTLSSSYLLQCCQISNSGPFPHQRF